MLFQQKSCIVMPYEKMEANVSLYVPSTSKKDVELGMKVREAIFDEIKSEDIVLYKTFLTAQAKYRQDEGRKKKE
jgi:hypothetical protein